VQKIETAGESRAVKSSSGQEAGAALPCDTEGARKRAAVETYVQHEAVLRRTAGRYSLCADDAEDALQRAFEILLTKAPTDDRRQLIRWTQTVVKHEALAVRRDRERILSGPAALATDPGREDWVALIPADAAGPAERAERHEEIARSREALQSLKPQELRALGLLAEGYSYLEIAEITGYSQTKVNRCLAEGRERFRKLLSRSEDGSRCEEIGALLSAFCDGEAGSEEAAVREHLRACAGCRAALRTYRAAPRAAAALIPALPLSRSLLERAHDALGGLAARLGGGGGGATDSGVSQVAAAGGTRGAGMAALAKLVALCVGTAGGAAACVATVVVPAPLGLGHERAQAPVLERTIDPVIGAEPERGVEAEAAPAPRHDAPEQEPAAAPHDLESAVQATSEAAATSGAVEYAEPEPVPAPEPASEGSPPTASAGSPAGEFGP
jgi:RNA polymerase sigma factor (sigma-70 family)